MVKGFQSQDYSLVNARIKGIIFQEKKSLVNTRIKGIISQEYSLVKAITLSN